MIRFWEQRDVIQLRKLVKALLENQRKHGSRILASEANISWHLRVGYLQVKTGDPHLVFEEEDEILGFVQIGELVNELETFGRTAEFFGMYVKPEARGRFVNVSLIRQAGLILAEKGYTHVRSSVLCSNTKSLNNFFHNPAIWPISVNLDWDIANDPQFENSKFVKMLERKAS